VTLKQLDKARDEKSLQECAKMEAAVDQLWISLGHHIPSPRGGYRPNAKRPKVLPEGTKQWNIQVTDDEKEKIKALLEELRKPSK
jgi:hypothetical protein